MCHCHLASRYKQQHFTVLRYDQARPLFSDIYIEQQNILLFIYFFFLWQCPFTKSWEQTVKIIIYSNKWTVKKFLCWVFIPPLSLTLPCMLLNKLNQIMPVFTFISTSTLWNVSQNKLKSLNKRKKHFYLIFSSIDYTLNSHCNKLFIDLNWIYVLYIQQIAFLTARCTSDRKKTDTFLHASRLDLPYDT